MLISAGESKEDFLMTLPRGIQPANSHNFSRLWQREQWEQLLLGETKPSLSSCGRLHLNPLSLAVAVASAPSSSYTKQLHNCASSFSAWRTDTEHRRDWKNFTWFRQTLSILPILLRGTQFCSLQKQMFHKMEWKLVHPFEWDCSQCMLFLKNITFSFSLHAYLRDQGLLGVRPCWSIP